MAGVSEAAVRAARLFMAVSFAVALGVLAMYIVGPDDEEVYHLAKSATAAAGITCAALSQSTLIGQLARAGGENVVGTLLGGTLGLATFLAAHAIAERTHFGSDRVMQEFLLRAGCAPFVGALGVGFGQLVAMPISGRLVLLTYLLSEFNNASAENAAMFAVFRVSGILGGVLCSALAQVLVFPRSAATECLRLLAEALQALVQLNAGQVWRAAVPLPAHQEGDEECQPLLHPDDVWGQGANHYGTINHNCNDCIQLLSAARHEIYVGRRGRCWCFLPGCLCDTGRLPADMLLQVMKSSRRLARLLYALHLLLADPLSPLGLLQAPGTGSGPGEAGSREQARLELLAGALHQTLVDCWQAFAKGRDSVPSASLHAFLKAVPSTTEEPGFAELNPLNPLNIDEHQGQGQQQQQPHRRPGSQPAQVRWHAFQFLCEQISAEIGDLHARLGVLLRQLDECY